MDLFYKKIYDRHLLTKTIPINEEIIQWGLDLFDVLFPERSAIEYENFQELKQALVTLKLKLSSLICPISKVQFHSTATLSETFFNNIPDLYDLLNTDIQAIYDGDPAAQSGYEIIRAYPGFFAMFFYRIAHCLHNYEIELLPRILTEYAHSLTGIDIHPAAKIGAHFHIDHGTGIVIGESTEIGRNVKLYQGVTLGALSVSKDMAFKKRHPTIEDGVTIYAGATILGGDTIVGAHSTIGGNIWLTASVPPYSTLYHTSTYKMTTLPELTE